MKKIIIILMAVITFSCSSNRDYYKKCMTKYKNQTGVDFYKSLGQFKDSLIANKLIIDKSKISYVKTINEINRNDEKWRNFYNKFKNSKMFSDIESSYVEFVLKCSNIKQATDDIYNPDINSTMIQMYFISQIQPKIFENSKMLDLIFLFSDLNQKTNDLNLMYIIFTDMYYHFEKH